MSEDVKKVEVVIPESWDDITVERYCEIEKFKLQNKELIELVSSDDYNSTSNLLKLYSGIFSVTTGITEEDIADYDYEDFMKYAEEILKVIASPIIAKDREYIELEGEKYYPRKDFNKRNIYEVELLSELYELDNSLLTVMDQMLTVMLLKKKDDGTLEKFLPSMINRKDIFKNAIITEVNELFVFFSDGGQVSPKDFRNSLNKEKTKK